MNKIRDYLAEDPMPGMVQKLMKDEQLALTDRLSPPITLYEVTNLLIEGAQVYALAGRNDELAGMLSAVGVVYRCHLMNEKGGPVAEN